MASAVEQETEAMGMTVVERKPTMLRPIAEPGEIIRAHKEMSKFIKEALTEGTEGKGDYGVLPGTDEKMLYKPGAEKIALGMGCTYGQPRIVEREVDHDRVTRWVKRKKEWYGEAPSRRFKWVEVSGESYGLYRYVIGVPVINRATGEVVGEGVGSCSSMESKYIDRPRDCENTVVKMAQKRAMVHACLIAFGLSGEFQSGEEDTDDADEQDAPAAKKAAPKAAAKAAAGVPTKCKKCGGADFWDNRAKKESGQFKPNAADFSCKNQDCRAGVWLRSKDSQNEDPGPSPDSEPGEDGLPF